MWASRGESFLSHLEMTREYLRVHSRFPSALAMPLYLMSEPVPLDMPVAVLGLNGVCIPSMSALLAQWSFLIVIHVFVRSPS